MTRPSNNGYGVDHEILGDILAQGFPGSGDPSLDLIVYIALALHSVEQLTQLASLQAPSDDIANHLVHTYRQAMHIRARQMPLDKMDTKWLSRFGRITAHVEFPTVQKENPA